MYSSSDLIIYYDKEFEWKGEINKQLIEHDIMFKVFNSLKLVFSAIKNPQNHVIIATNNPSTLHQIENIAGKCFDYQNRVFVIFSSTELVDNFFTNYCIVPQLNNLNTFICDNIKSNRLIQNNQTSTLLNKLVALELENLGLSTKYVGFKYLVGAVSNALSKNFYTNNHIDLFANIASTHLETIDTVERDVRHMLRTTWKNSAILRDTFKSTFIQNKIPNARDLLQAIIEYLKTVI